MKKFRVSLSGENFCLQMETGIERLGFYTTRYVEAENEAEAEVTAIGFINQDPDLRDLVLNEDADPPRLYADDIAEIATFEGLAVPGEGYTFYPEA